MEKLRNFFLENWLAKGISLFVAIAIWFVIWKNIHLSQEEFPIPGTTIPASARPPSLPSIDDRLLNSLTPTTSAPIPGGEDRK